MDFFKKAQASMGGSAGESDLLKQAEGFFGSQEKTEAPAASTENPAEPAAIPAPAAGGEAAAAAPDASGKSNYSEVYGSAQTLYQGLQDKLGGKESNVDNQELAGAASDVLKAAENAGFAKDSQYGEYFDKAEGYLQNYAKPKSAAAAPISEAPADAAPAVPAAEEAAEPAK